MGACPSKEDGPSGTTDDTGPPPTGPTGAPPPPPNCDFKIGDTVKHRDPGAGYTGVVTAITNKSSSGEEKDTCQIITVKRDDTGEEINIGSDELEKYTPPPPPPPPPGIYFQTQDKPMSCGRNAINNMVGKEVYTFYNESSQFSINKPKIDLKNPKFPIGLPRLCAVLEEEEKKLYKGVSDYVKRFGCLGSQENYTVEILISALSLLGFKSRKDYNSQDKLGDFLINFGTNSLNYGLINKGTLSNGSLHWVSVRLENDKYYYFDSLRKKPDIFDNKDDFTSMVGNELVSKSFVAGYLFEKLTDKPLDPLRALRESLPKSTEETQVETGICATELPKHVYHLLKTGKYENYDITTELLNKSKPEYDSIRNELIKELQYKTSSNTIYGQSLDELVNKCPQKEKDKIVQLNIRIRNGLNAIQTFYGFKQGGKRKTYRKKSRSSKKTIRKH